MELFERLAAAAKRQGEEADLPSWLLAGILDIAGSPGHHAAAPELIELLLKQVENFDSYAGAGCFGDAASAGTIQATLRRIADAGN